MKKFILYGTVLLTMAGVWVAQMMIIWPWLFNQGWIPEVVAIALVWMTIVVTVLVLMKLFNKPKGTHREETCNSPAHERGAGRV